MVNPVHCLKYISIRHRCLGYVLVDFFLQYLLLYLKVKIKNDALLMFLKKRFFKWSMLIVIKM